jgi:hypothetical protein
VLLPESLDEEIVQYPDLILGVEDFLEYDQLFIQESVLGQRWPGDDVGQEFERQGQVAGQGVAALISPPRASMAA